MLERELKLGLYLMIIEFSEQSFSPVHAAPSVSSYAQCVTLMENSTVERVQREPLCRPGRLM